MIELGLHTDNWRPLSGSFQIAAETADDPSQRASDSVACVAEPPSYRYSMTTTGAERAKQLTFVPMNREPIWPNTFEWDKSWNDS